MRWWMVAKCKIRHHRMLEVLRMSNNGIKHPSSGAGFLPSPQYFTGLTYGATLGSWTRLPIIPQTNERFNGSEPTQECVSIGFKPRKNRDLGVNQSKMVMSMGYKTSKHRDFIPLDKPTIQSKQPNKNVGEMQQHAVNVGNKTRMYDWLHLRLCIYKK